MASLAMNTCIDPEKFGKLTIPKMETLFQGFEEANKDQGGTSSSPDRLCGQEAIDFLINSGGHL